MVKITLISLLLLSKFTLNVVYPILSTEIIEFDMPFAHKTTSTHHSFTTIKTFNIINKGDVLISEVLFNPRTGGVDFVEIFNHSNHEIDLKELQLANVNTAGQPANIKNISSTKLMIAPGSYWVITTNTANVKQNYYAKFTDRFVQISSTPAFNNDKGSVVLLSSNQVIDQLDYNAKIHHPLIRDEDGISLERVSFDVPANETGNFKSAAASVGFATPTYRNSQEIGDEKYFAKLQSNTFSPDGDNFEDLLMLSYQVGENATLANVNIFDDKGRLVKKVLKNQTIGTNGDLFWDGINDKGTRAPVGIYIILFEYFNLNGKRNTITNTFVLANKLND
ncbi:lamin tail domain-containing protein [Pedobacter sandarakinus]|uniref:lamin tail domain-containing protein n=1 Tax=Pedobacter sandarakinus TaxID=353156 RepID=UPI002247506B|nr:lamin tail domain-containing protein [Pedobacter sandarakinus]MCX2572986.1 lamin tail domain-containing protein [Pedobacter sandarakinus]